MSDYKGRLNPNVTDKERAHWSEVIERDKAWLRSGANRPKVPEIPKKAFDWREICPDIGTKQTTWERRRAFARAYLAEPNKSALARQAGMSATNVSVILYRAEAQAEQSPLEKYLEMPLASSPRERGQWRRLAASLGMMGSDPSSPVRDWLILGTTTR